MSYQRKHADLFLLFTDQTQPLVEPYSNRFTLWKEGAELNDFVHPLSFVVYWHFLGKLSLNGVSIFIHTSLLFSFFFSLFLGLFIPKPCLGYEILLFNMWNTFWTNIQKAKWPKVGLILEEWHSVGFGGIQCWGSVQLLSFMSFEFELLYSSFLICKLCLKKSSFIHLIRTDSNVFLLMAE